MGGMNTFLRVLLGGVQGFGQTYADQEKLKQKAALDQEKLNTAAKLAKENSERNSAASVEKSIITQMIANKLENGEPIDFGSALADGQVDMNALRGLAFSKAKAPAMRPVFRSPTPTSPQGPTSPLKPTHRFNPATGKVEPIQ